MNTSELQIKSVVLANGASMPILGLGTSQVPDPKELEAAIDEALRLGYRHFDTAYLYRNENTIGRVHTKWLESGQIKREDIFIVTKLPWVGMSASRVEHFLNLSLAALGLTYVDLYLIHWPIALHYVDDNTMIPKKDGELFLDHESDLESVWKSMEEQVKEGRAKGIGVSNFNIGQMQRILNIAKIPPINLQVEMHVYFQQKQLIEFCKENGIAVTAYSPLGSPGRTNHKFFQGKFVPPPILNDPTVLDIAKKHNKSPAAILLRFLTQLGIAVIPKSKNPERLKTNLESTMFDLTPSDMDRLKDLDKGEEGRAFCTIPGSERHKDCPFKSRSVV